MLDLERLVDLPTGQISNEIFVDEAVYGLEMQRIFARCWLMLGHESLVPDPGDYITNFMGEDAVVVCRDTSGRLRVFLNKCRHRGNRVCLFDHGSASAFTCSFHGWSYSLNGQLVGVPFYDEAYHGELDREQWHLHEAPRVQAYAGLIFACWDPGGVSLETYLGDARWYLETFLAVEYLGGLEILPGKHRYLMPGNWKLQADNLAGDDYHFPVTHGSLAKVAQLERGSRIDTHVSASAAASPQYAVCIGHTQGIAHGLGGLALGEDSYEHDLAQAKRLGAEAVDWVRYRYQRLQAALQHCSAKPYSFHHGNIFPHFSINGLGSAIYGRSLILWHPRGPHQTEVWQWCAVEKEAPAIVKKMAAFVVMQRFSAAGMVAPDDNENFDRLTDNLQTYVSRQLPFNYAMALGRDESLSASAAGDFEGLPGLVVPLISEVNQRQFYRCWAEFMARAE